MIRNGTHAGERREHRRARLTLPVQPVLERIGTVTGLFVTDLSEGGAYIRTDLPFPVGTEFRLCFHPGSWPGTIEATGRVVRYHTVLQRGSGPPPGMAVRFTDHRESGWQFLQTLIWASPRSSET
jgi:Tfp pilus assembly protein PilZ